MPLNDNPEQQKLIDKVRKLMAVAGSTSNETEAATFATRAQELVAQHNLDMADIIGTDKTIESVEFSEPIEMPSAPWKRTIGNALALCNFCNYFYHSDGINGRYNTWRDRHFFIGRPSNIVVTEMLFGYLLTTVERLAEEAFKQSGEKAKKKSAYLKSFHKAASIRLYVRLMEQRKQQCAAPTVTATGTTLPALANLFDQAQAEIDSAKEQMKFQGTVKRDRSKLSHSAGAEAGDKAGKEIGLDPQVKSSTKPLALPPPK